ncbi:potassium-transporting ATPase subunit KdpC [Geosporobacter ferrireducens]|uniref:Potassium-transporting ATPase KdpC subunit n=1 Tax=Geosporobacter ferrireducens TaxID=1424294 RepID=A0A1D8GEX3_9FIRM|nr:potassium-transporting ATPase subunit KdpC [Geosporobacter ferrireducens]AOT69456.1 potassium-transporting ATPase subunit C [Geosporobacter ferrireducens]
MKNNVVQQSFKFVLVMTIITGFIYPLACTAIAQIIFPDKANGSILYQNNKPVASELIGQEFTSEKYFWSRLSATSPYPYNGGDSSGSNKTPAGEEIADAVQQRIKLIRALDPENDQKIPVDFITASGSGLDPHISPAAALYQAGRISKVRNIEKAVLMNLIEKNTEKRQLGILGEPRVNVVKLNIDLDNLE